MIEFLTHEQVCELTGASRRKAQIDNLAANNIRHTIKVSGWPCVTVAAVLGTGSDAELEADPEAPTWVFDLSKVK